MTLTITYHVGDVRDVLAAMPDSSVDLLVTSPPFLALRSYLPDDHPDKHREIGAEPTPAAFLDTMLALTADWRRVVADWGSIAVEIGDSYAGGNAVGTDHKAKSSRYPNGRGVEGDIIGCDKVGPGWPLAKSLCGIPTLYTWSLAYGRNLLTGTPSPAGQWRIRNLLTWTRPNPPVGALGDKFRPATSFVTVATVDKDRWFDLDAVRHEHGSFAGNLIQYSDNGEGRSDRNDFGKQRYSSHHPAGAPPLDWWDANDWQPLHRLPTQPYKGSHYAAFPVALPARLIEAMCPREVCSVCGEPRRRVVRSEKFVLQGAHWNTHKRDPSKGRLVPASEAMNTTGRRQSEDDHKTGIAGGGEDQQGFITHTTTVGWTDCPCWDAPVGHAPVRYRPGIVLDPFGGSGTTALAAAQAGRDAVLIDIDHRNVDLARHRITESMRLVAETIDGDTIRWTVDPDLPGTKGQHPDQLSIFDQVEVS